MQNRVNKNPGETLKPDPWISQFKRNRPLFERGGPDPPMDLRSEPDPWISKFKRMQPAPKTAHKNPLTQTPNPQRHAVNIRLWRLRGRMTAAKSRLWKKVGSPAYSLFEWINMSNLSSTAPGRLRPASLPRWELLSRYADT
jgi:hypothetical protein